MTDGRLDVSLQYSMVFTVQPVELIIPSRVSILCVRTFFCSTALWYKYRRFLDLLGGIVFAAERIMSFNPIWAGLFANLKRLGRGG